jgi:hypothetical protein
MYSFRLTWPTTGSRNSFTSSAERASHKHVAVLRSVAVRYWCNLRCDGITSVALLADDSNWSGLLMRWITVTNINSCLSRLMELRKGKDKTGRHGDANNLLPIFVSSYYTISNLLEYSQKSRALPSTEPTDRCALYENRSPVLNY